MVNKNAGCKHCGRDAEEVTLDEEGVCLRCNLREFLLKIKREKHPEWEIRG